MGKTDHIWRTDFAVAHTDCLARSFRHWTGRELAPGVSGPAELARRVFEARFVLVSHGIEPDPVLNYGNRAALELWEMTWEELTRTPSRLTAEAPSQEDRAVLLAAVTERGFIEGYSGVRVSKSGRRFRIVNALVWNLRTDTGGPRGQAAIFDQWQYL